MTEETPNDGLTGETPNDGLTVRDVEVRIAGKSVLGPVSLSVEPGTVVAVLGANGAGKSTLLRAIVGLAAVARGRIWLGGAEISDWPPERRVRAGVGWAPEGRRLFPGLTVAETLDVAAPGNAASRAARIEAMLQRFPMLADKRHETAWRLSGGQQQMLAIARAVIADPPVVLLDEPSLGLAPVVRDRVFEAVRTQADGGSAVLLAEQDIGRALAVADRVVVLSRGRLLLDWPTEVAIGNPNFEQALIGA